MWPRAWQGGRLNFGWVAGLVFVMLRSYQADSVGVSWVGASHPKRPISRFYSGLRSQRSHAGNQMWPWARQGGQLKFLGLLGGFLMMVC